MISWEEFLEYDVPSPRGNGCRTECQYGEWKVFVHSSFSLVSCSVAGVLVENTDDVTLNSLVSCLIFTKRSRDDGSFDSEQYLLTTGEDKEMTTYTEACNQHCDGSDTAITIHAVVRY